MAISPRLFFRKPDTKKDDVRKALAVAQEARVSFNLDCFLNKRLVMQLKGLCTEIRQDSIRLYLRGEKGYVPPAGLQVHAYFTLREGRKTIPHDFLCDLTRIERVGDDIYLMLSIPEDMGHNQRRNNVRIAITTNDIPNFQLWHGHAVPSQAGDASRRLDWLPYDPAHAEIYDISAGGAQLAISPRSNLFPRLAIRETLLIGGDFTIKDKTEYLLLAASIVRLRTLEAPMPSQVGLHFRRWATRRDGKFQWMNLAPNDGVSPLGAWVFHIILQRSRIAREKETLLPPPLQVP